MPTPRYTLRESYFPNAPHRNLFKEQIGWNGDKKSAYPYRSTFERSYGEVYFPESEVYTALDAGNSPGAIIVGSSRGQSVYNTAYARFLGKVRGDAAQLGATMGEYGSSSQMVKNRAQSLYKFTKNLSMRWAKLPTRKKRLYRRFSDYWLEFSFGWSPLFGDMFNAMQQLSTPFDRLKVCRAGAASPFDYEQNLGNNPKTVGHYMYKVLIFGKIRIENPNYALMNNIGLANPAAIAWELVPYSFVADWLFDIGGWIGSWTDKFGYEYVNSGVNEIQYGSRSMTWSAGLGQSRCTSVVSRRTLGVPLPLPNFDVLKNVGRNLKRALNALALTGQILDRGFPQRPKRRGGSRR